MSTIKDFENAPVGATATTALGSRAVKIYDCWLLSDGRYLDDKDMENYTLDQPAPTTAREALDLAWELAHEVKEGQVIPEGSRYLTPSGSGLKEFTAPHNVLLRSGHATVIRTLDPLPAPEPDWLDAPAVLARVEGWVSCHDPQVFTRENKTGTRWVLDTKVYRWDELIDVTPLYPKGQDEWCRAEHCTWRHWRSGSVPTHKRGADCPREEKGQDT